MKNSTEHKSQVMLDDFLYESDADEMGYEDELKLDFDQAYLEEMSGEGLDLSDTEDFDDDDFGGVF
jgi:hypothetical protein